jgi:hypothetical protein
MPRRSAAPPTPPTTSVMPDLIRHDGGDITENAVALAYLQRQECAFNSVVQLALRCAEKLSFVTHTLPLPRVTRFDHTHALAGPFTKHL